MVDNMSKIKSRLSFCTENDKRMDEDYYMVITSPENLSSNASPLTNDPKKSETIRQQQGIACFFKMSDFAMSKLKGYRF